MAKFFGAIGYSFGTKQATPGVWIDDIVEKNYYGDVLRNTRRLESGENLNDNLRVDNLISIVADAYAYENFFAIRYISWMGALWKVASVDASQRPRLVLTIGGVYNGPTASTT